MKTLLFVTFTALCTLAYAQPRVITFDSDQKSEEDSELEKNVVKVSLFELASGDFPIYYERVLSDRFTAEVSAGITFGDYYGSLFSSSEISPLESSVDAKYGYSFSAAIRFYPIEALDEFYISPEFKYRKYNWDRDVEAFIDGPPYTIQETVSENRVYVMPRITFGYTYFYDYNLSLDWHVGVGMNTPTESIYDFEVNQVIQEKQNTRPRLHLGLKIGYIF